MSMADDGERAASRARLLASYLRGERPRLTGGPPPLRPDPTADPPPLSFAQEQVWRHCQLAPDAPLYNESVALHHTGPLDEAALRRSLQAIVRRHAAWRTTFPVVDGQPIQCVHADLPAAWQVMDLHATLPAARAATLDRRAAAAVRQPFDLERGPLVRATLVRMGDAEHQLLLVLHHLIFDGASIVGVLLPELLECYNAAINGRLARLPALPVQYADFTRWERAWLDDAVLAPHLAFWRAALADSPPPLALPADYPPPAVPTFAGALHRFALPSALWEALAAQSRAANVTPFVTLLAAFQVLLQRVAAQTDLTVGIMSGARQRPEIEGLLGLFLNLVLVRVDLSGDPPFPLLVQRTRTATVRALDHAAAPYARVLRQAPLPRDGRGQQLPRVVFSLEPPAPALPPGWSLHRSAVASGTAKFDLYLEIEADPRGGAVGRLHYSSELFQAATIERLAAQYQTLLAGVCADPAHPISDLPLLDERERRQVLHDWNAASTPYPRDGSIAAVFEAQARARPGAPALASAEERLTYGELDARAEAVAHRLRRLGVGPEVLVGVCAERSSAAIVAILAILKAGGAYLPLDPADPPARLAALLGQLGAPLVLAAPTARQLLPPFARALDLDGSGAASEWAAAPPPPAAPSGRHLACALATSGSTGTPKLVLVEARSILRLVLGSDYAAFGPNETFLHLAPLAFDASSFEIWGALLHGAKLVLYPPELPTAGRLGELIAREGVTTLWLTAGLFQRIVDDDPGALRPLRQLLTGGEAPAPAAVRRLRAVLPGLRLSNGYGPTENATFSSVYVVPAGEAVPDPLPIGRPIANTRCYVLDRAGQPCPVGVAGELFLGGDGLARGYLGQAALTAERFVPDPFGPEPGGRLYRTGDRARWQADGNLAFLGRRDGQVKLRGYRVELGEVEAALARCPAVRAAAAAVHAGAGGDRQLVAYLVPRAALPPDAALRAFLAELLPPQMLPAAFVRLAALPLTASGKLDRRALPPPTVTADPPSVTPPSLAPPLDGTAARLAAIWERVLGAPPDLTGGEFFTAGGRSLQAITLLDAVEREFQQRLPPAALLRGDAFTTLADLLRRGVPALPPGLEPIQPHGDEPPLYCVHGVDGGAFPYLALARRLPPAQPLFGLTAPPPAASGDRFTSIEELAARHVAALRAAPGAGPYHLIGYSFGGIVAFEVAQQLVRGGGQVAFLGLIDTAPRAVRPASFWAPGALAERLGLHLRALRPLGTAERLRYLRRRAQLVLVVARETWGARMRPPGAAAVAVEPDWLASLRRYVPRPYPGPLTLFWAEEHAPGIGGPDDPRLEWRRYAQGGITIRRLPGDHDHLLEEPAVAGLAAALADCLDGAGQPPHSHQLNDRTP